MHGSSIAQAVQQYSLCKAQMLNPQVLVVACLCTALVSYVMKAFCKHLLLGAGAGLGTYCLQACSHQFDAASTGD